MVTDEQRLLMEGVNLGEVWRTAAGVIYHLGANRHVSAELFESVRRWIRDSPVQRTLITRDRGPVRACQLELTTAGRAALGFYSRPTD